MTSEEDRVARYLSSARQFKRRRLTGLIVLCVLLIAVLVLIYARGWYNLTGTASNGSAWIFVGIGVAVCAIAAVIADMLYRREL